MFLSTQGLEQSESLTGRGWESGRRRQRAGDELLLDVLAGQGEVATRHQRHVVDRQRPDDGGAVCGIKGQDHGAGVVAVVGPQHAHAVVGVQRKVFACACACRAQSRAAIAGRVHLEQPQPAILTVQSAECPDRRNDGFLLTTVIDHAKCEGAPASRVGPGRHKERDA